MTFNSQDGGKPVGSFTCQCGFCYVRSGPDQTEDDQYSYTSVRSYGSLWEGRLLQIWTDASLNLREKAQALRVTEETMMRHAMRLSLTFPAPGAGAKAKQPTKQPRPKSVGIKLEENRKKWLNLMGEHPEATVDALIALLPDIYKWLYRTDFQWLDEQLAPRKRVPKNSKPRSSSTIVDWHARDISIAEDVIAVVNRLKAMPGKPFKITRTRITKEIGNSDMIRSALQNLPVTRQTLNEVVDTGETFALRSLAWAVEEFVKMGSCPSRRTLLDFAGIRSHEKNPTVSTAVTRALDCLRRKSQNQI